MSLGFAGLEGDLTGSLEEAGELDAFPLDGAGLETTSFTIQARCTAIGCCSFIVLIGGLVVELCCANEESAAIVDGALGHEIDLAFTTTRERRRGGREQQGGDERQERENTHGFLPKKA